MQNHRLYNTKKDYVLDYLDRHNNNHHQSSICSSTSSSSSSSSCLNEKNGGVLFTTTNQNIPNTMQGNVNNNRMSAVDISSTIHEDATVAHQPINQVVSHYERFPYLRNSRENKTSAENFNKYAPNPNFKRTQSNSCIQARQCQNLVNLPVTTTPRSIFSASVDRLNATATANVTIA